MLLNLQMLVANRTLHRCHSLSTCLINTYRIEVKASTTGWRSPLGRSGAEQISLVFHLELYSLIIALLSVAAPDVFSWRDASIHAALQHQTANTAATVNSSQS